MATPAVSRRASSLNLLVAAVVAQTGFSIVDQGIPTLTGFVKADLDVSATVAGLAVSAFAFGKIFGSYAAGVAADRLGERRVILAGGLATATLVAVGTLSPLPLLLALLFAAGLASASSTPAGGRLVLLAFHDRRGLALGIRQTGIPLGGLIAAALLPWIARATSWRWSLAAATVLTLGCLVPLARMRTDPVPPLRGPRPGVRELATDRKLRLLTAWGCLLVTGQYVVLAFLGLDLHASAGLSLAAASSLVAVAQLGGVAGRVLWGGISDRALVGGQRRLLLMLTAFGTLSALLLFAAPRDAPIAVFALLAGLGGLALIGFQGIWVALIADAAGPERVGAATGFAVTFVLICVALTPPVYGMVADLTGSYRTVWIVLAGVVALAAIPAALLPEEPT